MRRCTLSLVVGAALYALLTTSAFAQDADTDGSDTSESPPPVVTGAVEAGGQEANVEATAEVDGDAPETSMYPDEEPVPSPPADSSYGAEPVPVAAPAASVEAEEATTEDEEESSWPFDLTASLFTRYEVREQYDQLGRADADAFRFRARVGLVTDKLELSDAISVVLRFVPQATGFWSMAGLFDPTLGLHIGVVEVFTGPVRLEVGRMEMSYGDELLIGTVDWHPVGRSFDGTRLRWNIGDSGAFADAFFTMVREGSPVTNFGNGDTYFTGLYGGIGPMIAEGLALDAYALALVSPTTTDPVAMLPVDARGRVTLGARYKQKLGMLDARAEAGVQVGSFSSTQSILAYQADAELGIRLLDDGLRVSLEGFYASGNDPDDTGTQGAWNHLFPTAHKWLGFADIIGFGGGPNGAGRSNVAGGVLHVTGKLPQGFGLYAHGHLFARPQDTVFVDATGTVTRVPAAMAGGEVDVGAKWTIATGLGLRAGYAIFVPSEGFYGTTTPAHFFELELRFTY